jgi:DNA replication initiation complex subunit (GINS family)
VTLNRPPLGIRITWARRTKDNYIYKPKKLTAEEKKLQRELYNSITPETIKELGPNEMYAKVCKNYGPNPNATGYNEFPDRKAQTYIDGVTGEKYTKDG